MFRTKITLLSVTLPLGAWQAWSILDQLPLVIRVAFAVVASFGIFMAILAATEYATVARRVRVAAPLFARVHARKRVAAAT
jgi:hypothetical protein